MNNIHKNNALDVFNSLESIRENEAAIASKSGALKSIKVIKDGDDFILLMKFSWSSEDVFLATQRNRREPRRFRDIGRLVKYIEENHPCIKQFTFIIQN